MSVPNSIVSSSNPNTLRSPFAEASSPASSPMMQTYPIYPGPIFPGVNGGYFYHVPAPSYIMTSPIFPFYNNKHENAPEPVVSAINPDLLPTHGKRICRMSPISLRDVKKAGPASLENIKVIPTLPTLLTKPLASTNILKNTKPGLQIGVISTAKPVITLTTNILDKFKIGMTPKSATISTAKAFDKLKIGITPKPATAVATNILDKLKIGLTTAKPKVIVKSIPRLGLIEPTAKRPTMVINTNLKPKLELPKT